MAGRRLLTSGLVATTFALVVGAPGAGAAGQDRTVVASFYPLAYAAERIGGTRVDVTDLTPAGAEPHDLELSPDQVDEVLDAAVAIVMGRGFQPAVEDTAAQRDGATLEVLPKVVDAGGEEVAEEGESGGLDPHVWLDPTLMAEVAGAISRELVDVDAAGAAKYRRNLRRFRRELDDLDERYRQRLTGCKRDLLVTSHEAFGYLADRYGLRQEGVAGISPDAEPDARRLGELADLARDEGVTTIFTEEAVSPRIAETLAREAGGLRTEVLSPLETLTSRQEKAGADYFRVMDDNLEKIARALGCP
jgi:zinc transport system substrate-binding protein